MTLIQIPIDHFHFFGNEIPKTRFSSWCEGVLNTSGARPTPAKCAYPPARPAKCAFPNLLVVCFVWLQDSGHLQVFPDCSLFFYFMLFYLYIYYFYAPEDIQFGEKLSNHPIKPHFRPLLGRFVTTFRSPRFPVFCSSHAPPCFCLTTQTNPFPAQIIVLSKSYMPIFSRPLSLIFSSRPSADFYAFFLYVSRISCSLRRWWWW